MSDESSLLLHSLHDFWSLIEPCLDAVAPKRILEVGSEAGVFTQDLLEWARDRDATVTAVEPLPQSIHRELVRNQGLRLVEAKSPGALAQLGAFEVCVVDGDHNYWVVSQELRLLFEHEPGPLAIVHDVGWPCARRDQYYEPGDIPDEHRHEFSYAGGTVPWRTELINGGFRGEGAFAYAMHEGGPRNGVLTAIEDFLAQRSDLEFMRIPCIFGLGFLFPSDAPWAERVRQIVGPLNESDLLRRLERNRLELFLRIIDPFGRSHGEAHAVSGLLGSLQREVEELQAEIATLRLQLASSDVTDSPSRGA